MVTSSAASDDVISCQCQTVHIYCICSLASSAPRVSRMLGAKCLLHPSLALSNSQLTEQSGCQSSFLQGRTESDSTEVKTVTLTLPDAALSSTLLVPQSVSAQELTANGGARTCWVRCLLRSVRRTSHNANRAPKGHDWVAPARLGSPSTVDSSSTVGSPSSVTGQDTTRTTRRNETQHKTTQHDGPHGGGPHGDGPHGVGPHGVGPHGDGPR